MQNKENKYDEAKWESEQEKKKAKIANESELENPARSDRKQTKREQTRSSLNDRHQVLPHCGRYRTHLPSTPFSPPAVALFSLRMLLASRLILDAPNRLQPSCGSCCCCSVRSEWLIAAALDAALASGSGPEMRGGAGAGVRERSFSFSLPVDCDMERPNRPGADSLGFLFSFSRSLSFDFRSQIGAVGGALRLPLAPGEEDMDGPARFRLDASFFSKPALRSFGARPNPGGGGEVGMGALAAAVR